MFFGFVFISINLHTHTHIFRYGGHDPFHSNDKMMMGGTRTRPSPPKTSPPALERRSSPHQKDHHSQHQHHHQRQKNQGYPITENIARRIWEDAVRKLSSARVQPQAVPFRYFMVLITVVARTVYPPEHPSMSSSSSEPTKNTLKLLLHNHVLPNQDLYQNAAAKRCTSSQSAQRHLVSMNTSTLLWESFLRYTVRGSSTPYLIDLPQFMHWLRDLWLIHEIDPEPLDTSLLPISSYTRIWPEDVASVKPYLSRYRDSIRKLYFAFVRERRSKAKQRALFKHGFSVSSSKKRDAPKLGFGWDDFKKFANLFKICPGLFSQTELRSLFVYALRQPNLSHQQQQEEDLADDFDIDLSLGSFKLALIHMACVVHKKRRRSDSESMSDRLKNLFTHMWSSLQPRLKRGPGRGISKSILAASSQFCEKHAKRMKK